MSQGRGGFFLHTHLLLEHVPVDAFLHARRHHHGIVFGKGVEHLDERLFVDEEAVLDPEHAFAVLELLHENVVLIKGVVADKDEFIRDVSLKTDEVELQQRVQRLDGNGNIASHNDGGELHYTTGD